MLPYIYDLGIIFTVCSGPKEYRLVSSKICNSNQDHSIAHINSLFWCTDRFITEVFGEYETR